jgi:hypothetical protein
VHEIGFSQREDARIDPRTTLAVRAKGAIQRGVLWAGGLGSKKGEVFGGGGGVR